MKKHQDGEDGDVGDEDEDLDIAEVVDMLAVQLEAIVQETVTRPSPEPARLLADRVAEADQVAIEYDGADPDDLGGVEGVPGVSMTFAILAAWISGAREELDTPDLADTVLDWITTQLGEPAAGSRSSRCGDPRCPGRAGPDRQSAR